MIGKALEGGDEGEARACLEALVNVAATRAIFFRPNVNLLGTCMLQIANSEGLEYETRSLAMEAIVSLSETSGAMVRKHKDIVKKSFETAMTFIWSGLETFDNPAEHVEAMKKWSLLEGS